MDPLAFPRCEEVIDLASDSDDVDLDDFVAYYDLDADALVPNTPLRANDPDNAIDLTALEDIPDIDVPPDLAPPLEPGPAQGAEVAEVLTEPACLQIVLNVLPDISVDHVTKLLEERRHQQRTHEECERLIAKILDDGAYPKEQNEVKTRKRKRGDDEDDDITEYENGRQDLTNDSGYRSNATTLLKDEFLLLPIRHIDNTFEEQRSLFKSYIVLEEQLRNYKKVRSPFTKLARTRNKKGIEFTLIEAGSPLPKELKAAKKRVEQMADRRRAEQETERAEKENLRQAQANDAMGECECCFDAFPKNRMTDCNGATLHYFCMNCAKTYVEGEMGRAKCRPVCFADTSCGGTFSRSQLLEFLGQTSFERLEHLQQQADLAAAGLDFLSECPFCDFKAECPPVEIDREFRCLNPKCEKISCRLCQKETHIPLSCEESKKDGNLTIRHVVEEAMSAALIRKCNRCKHPFVKEHGCNKMSCSHCGNIQCYVCSKNVVNYEHYGHAHTPDSPTKCPLHDNVEARHEEEVKKAAAEAMAKVRSEHPNISEADLMIQVSDRVKQAEQSRIGRANADHNGFPFHMLGNRLVVGPAAPPIAVPLGGRPRPVIRALPAMMRLRNHQVEPMPPRAAEGGPFEYYNNPGFRRNAINAQQPQIAHHHQPQPQPQPGNVALHRHQAAFNLLPLRAPVQGQQQNQEELHPIPNPWELAGVDLDMDFPDQQQRMHHQRQRLLRLQEQQWRQLEQEEREREQRSRQREHEEFEQLQQLEREQLEQFFLEQAAVDEAELEFGNGDMEWYLGGDPERYHDELGALDRRQPQRGFGD